MAREGGRAVGDAAAAGVGVRDEHERSRARGAALRDDVLGGAPAERPPERGDEQGGVEEREQGRDERYGGARDRHVDGEHAGRHGGCGEDRVGERPVGVGVERLELGVATEGGKPVAQMHRGAPLGVAAGRAPAELQERVELAERVDACGLAHRMGSMAAAVRVSARWPRDAPAPASSWPVRAAFCCCS